MQGVWVTNTGSTDSLERQAFFKQMNMTKADYNFSIQKHLDKKIILIEDQNLGGTSVTNCIESIVSEICKERNIDCEKCIILYKDTTGLWDGWDCRKNEFIHLDGTTWKEAFERM